MEKLELENYSTAFLPHSSSNVTVGLWWYNRGQTSMSRAALILQHKAPETYYTIGWHADLIMSLVQVVR